MLEKTLESPLDCKEIKLSCLELQKQLVALNFKLLFLLYYCNCLLIMSSRSFTLQLFRAR